MKIEKISDTQIKCTLTHEDLKSRNMDISELAYGTEKAKRLFLEMMEMASNEVGFEADGFSIMVEAIPCRDEGIILMITKVEDPEEIDSRFARFTPTPDTAKNPLELLLSMITESVPAAQVQKPALADVNGFNKCFLFKSLDAAIEAAEALGGEYDGVNTLYKNPRTKEYYLYLDTPASDETINASTLNVLSEYAELSQHNNVGKAYLDEHFETIIKNNALNALSQI